MKKNSIHPLQKNWVKRKLSSDVLDDSMRLNSSASNKTIHLEIVGEKFAWKASLDITVGFQTDKSGNKNTTPQFLTTAISQMCL